MEKKKQHRSTSAGRKSSFSQARKESLAGILAGACGRVVEYPLDFLRIKLNNQLRRKRKYPLQNVSTINTAQSIWKKEGWIGFYRGAMPLIVSSAAESSVAFTLYNRSLHYMALASSSLSSTSITSTATLAFSSLFSSSSSSCQADDSLTINTDIMNNINKTNGGIISNKNSNPPMNDGIISSNINKNSNPPMNDGIISSNINKNSNPPMNDGIISSNINSNSNPPMNDGIISSNINKNSNPPMNRILVAGMFAGIGTTCVLTPIERIRLKMVNSSSYKNSFDCVLRMFQKEGGLRAFTVGGAAISSREVPGNAMYFFTYEKALRSISNSSSSSTSATSSSSSSLQNSSIKNSSSQQQQQQQQQQINSNNSNRRDSPWYAVPLSGALAGVAYITCFYPANVAHTFICSDKKYRKLGLLEAMKKIYVNGGGVKALYCGASISALRAIPSNAAIFSVYELVLRQL